MVPRRARRHGGGRRRGTTVRELLEEATRYQQAGRPGDAEAICRRILEVRPEQPHALCLLGIAAYQARKDPRAVQVLQRALELKPDFAPAHDALGSILRGQGHLDAALAAHRRALELDPQMVSAHQGLGAVLLARGEVGRALAAYEHAVALAPEAVGVAAELAEVLRRVGRTREAVAVARDAVARLPDSSEAHGLLAIALHHQGRLDDALASHRRAVELAPDAALAHTNLGVTLHALGDLEGAAAAHEHAVALDPRNARAQHNRGLVLMELGRLDDAVECLRAALVITPGDADLHWDQALALLGAGRLREGWDELEWRWQATAFPSTARHADRPRWDGSALAGRHLLLWAEQGLGDAIQLVRYVPLLARPGARVSVECAPELQRLLCSLPGVASVVSHAEPGDFDVHLPLMSVPRLFGTTTRSIPATVPYLAPDLADRERWRAELAGEGELRAGLVWAGSPTHRNDRNRSIAPGLLEPLLAVPGVRWFGLQVGERAAPPPAGPMTDLGPRLADFAETAAVIANLDLVVTVDTAAAHLAGAIGAPVCLLLPHAPDWRWMQAREDSPWYPTMRLFRQERRGAWEPVIARVAAEVARRVTDGGGR